MLLFSARFVLPDYARAHKIAHWYHAQQEVTSNGLCAHCAHGCDNGRVYMFRGNILHGRLQCGSFGEDRSLPVPIPGHIHLQSPSFHHRALPHPKPLCRPLLYLCIQCGKKRNALGSLMECSSARGVTGFYFLLFFFTWAAPDLRRGNNHTVV